jgi:cytochrome bd ubiquinol oxidase subunit I
VAHSRARARHERPGEHDRVIFSMAMWMAAIVAPFQILVGDLHGLNTLEHQPQKVMAMEGHFKSYPEGAPLILFGIPDQERMEMRHAVEIPKLSSLILRHDLNAPLAGLDTIPAAEQPPVAIVFWAFRVMVTIGFLIAALGVWSLIARWRKRLFLDAGLHRFALAMSPAGLIAVLAGWITTEVGRQPYVVYRLLRTADAASPVQAAEVGSTLAAFVIVYFAIFGAGTFYLLRLMATSPRPGQLPEPRLPIRTAGIAQGPVLPKGGLGQRPPAGQAGQT